MDAGEPVESPHDGPEPKVQRVIREYGLEDLAETLAARWRGDDGPRRSLRTLAGDLNRAVLEAAMREAGMRPLDGEVGNLHRLLTGVDVGAAQRTEAETKLERNGINPDELRNDFVSHQSVHTYLRDYRGVSLPESDDADRVEATLERVQRTTGRLRSVAEQALGQVAGEELTLGETELFVSIEVYCNDCGRQFELEELADRGGCDCDPDRTGVGG